MLNIKSADGYHAFTFWDKHKVHITQSYFVNINTWFPLLRSVQVTDSLTFPVFVVFVEYFPKKRIPDFSLTFPVFVVFVEYFPKRRMTNFSLIFP